MSHIVTRTYGKYRNTDYLTAFDIIWGPVWTGARKNAVTFETAAKAEYAMDAAVAIMRPRPFMVPDFGSDHTLEVVSA